MIEDILAGLLRVNLAASAAILLVLLLRRPWRRAFGPRAAYTLWTLVPLAVAGSLLPAPAAQTALSPVVLAVAAAAARAAPAAAGGDQAAHLLAGLWIAGVIAAGGLLALRQRRFVASLGAMTPMAGAPGVLRAERAGVGPALVGAWRPRIVAPADFETRFAPQEREVILAHERVHLVGGDARVNAIAAAAQCLAWFNPLAHLAVHLMRVDQELACDAVVIARFPQARRLYAEVLLKTQLAAYPLPLDCHWPSRAQHPLKERIAMMKFPTPTAARRVGGLALAAALGLGGACAAWAAQSPAPAMISAPDWVQRPSGEDVARVYPAAARARGAAGMAVIECRVDAEGRLEACAVAKETPGEGFGLAALELSKRFQMRAVDRTGAPTRGGQLRIPFRFVPPEAAEQAK